MNLKTQVSFQGAFVISCGACNPIDATQNKGPQEGEIQGYFVSPGAQKARGLSLRDRAAGISLGENKAKPLT